MRYRDRQQGNTLVIAMFMLILLTFVAVSSINMTTTNVQIVGNMQFQEEAVAVAQQAIEAASITSFNSSPPIDQNFDINGDDATDYVVTFQAPTCKYYTLVDLAAEVVSSDCYGSGGASLCYWTVWDLTATATDTRTGASATVTQGIRAIAGLNNYLDLCEP